MRLLNCLLSLALLFSLSPVPLAVATSIPKFTASEDLEDFLADTPKVVLYISAEWCDQCKHFLPTLDRVVHRLKQSRSAADGGWDNDAESGPVTFAEVAGDLGRGVSVKHAGDTFPALLIFKKGKFVTHFKGDKTESEVIDWISQYLGPPITKVASEQSLARLKKHSLAVFEIAITSKDAPEYAVLTNVASRHPQYGRFVLASVGVPSTTISVQHEGEIRREHEITTEEALEKWLRFFRFPVFGRLTSSNQVEYYSTGKDPVIFLGSRRAIREHRKEFAAAAELLHETHSFVYVHNEDPIYQPLTTSMGIEMSPTFVVFTGTGNTKEHKRYLYKGAANFNDRTVILQFVQQAHRGEIRPIVRSGPVLAEAEQNKRLVKDVVGDNFESLVLQENKDFLLMMMGPVGNQMFEGCKSCEKAGKTMELIAERLGTGNLNNFVVFGAMDITKNEIPLRGFSGDWHFTDLPVLYLVQAGSRVPLIKVLRDDFNASTILNFWLQNSKILGPTDRDSLEAKTDNILSLSSVLDLSNAKQGGSRINSDRPTRHDEL